MNQDFQNQQPDTEQFQGFDAVPPAPESRAHKGFSIASLVLGIVSVCSCCCCCCGPLLVLPLLCGILAIVFAVIAMKKAPDRKMPGIAVAGIILGAVGILLSILLLLFSFVMFTSEDFWIEYEAALREELGDEMYEEYFGDMIPSAREPLA